MLLESASRAEKEVEETINGLQIRGVDPTPYLSALNMYKGRFTSEVKISLAKNNEEKLKYYKEAEDNLKKAQQYFIADNFPVDFITISSYLGELKQKMQYYEDALKEVVQCIKVLNPTALVKKQKYKMDQLPQTRSQVENMKPFLFRITRNILRDYLKKLKTDGKDTNQIFQIYSSSLKMKAIDVNSLLLQIKTAYSFDLY